MKENRTYLFPTQVIDVTKYNRWDLSFLHKAYSISLDSKDPSTKVGAIITSDNKFVSTGYNGFPRKMKDEQNLLENRESKIQRTIHAEINALIFAESSLEGMTIYTWPFPPCDACSLVLIQAGISRVVYPHFVGGFPERWRDSFEQSLNNFSDCGVEVCGVLFEGAL